jgi:hypothetical protein
VPDYRIYPVDRAGHILGPSTVIECADDREAIQQAQQAVNGHGSEIWQAARFILRLSSDQASHIGLPLAGGGNGAK